VPVTVKLSKRFYDKLGDDVANELAGWFNQVDATYKAELREAIDGRFVQFEAKLEQRVAGLEAKLGQRAAGLEAKLEQRIAESEGRLHGEIAELRGDMRAGFATLKSEILTWTLVFWAGTMGTMIALIKL
jgi:hypothetical protein